MKHDWQDWIERIGRNDVSEQDLLDFQQVLAESPEQRDDYMDALLTETALEMEGGLPAVKGERGEINGEKIISLSSATEPVSRTRLPMMAMAASVALMLGLSYWLGRQQSVTAPERVEHVATITDADKAADAVGLRIGKPLHTGEVMVPEGAQIGIAMRGGARLEINGPASIRIDGPDRVYLHKGRVQTYAPEYAHGFTIDTDEGKVIDLGTRFVTTNGTDAGTEIHVIEGLVKAGGSGSQEGMLSIHGQNAVILKDGKMLDTEYLAQRLKIPLDPNLTDSDGDNFPDVIEIHYGTNIDDPKSFPEALRIAESFQGYGDGLMKGAEFRGLGKVSHWMGGGRFLREGLEYENGGKHLATSGGCLQTTGENGVGATIIPDSKTLPDAGVVYISFLMQQPRKNLDRAFSGLILYQDDYKEQLFLGELSVADSYGSRYAESSEEDPFSVRSDDKPHLFVIRIDRTRYLTDVFIDPPLGNGGKTPLPHKRYQDALPFNRIVVRSGSDSANFPVKFDEIRVGLTWESVLPVKR